MSNFEHFKAWAKAVGDYHARDAVQRFESKRKIDEAKRQARARERECEEKTGCEI